MALKNFHTYLYGQNVLLRTDNSAVSWMRSLKRPTGQVARWLQELSTYDRTVVHRPGKRHVNADALSRMPCKSCKRQQDKSSPDTYESDAEQEISLPVEESTDYECVQLNEVTRTQNAEALIQGSVLLNGWDHSDMVGYESHGRDADPSWKNRAGYDVFLYLF